MVFRVVTVRAKDHSDRMEHGIERNIGLEQPGKAKSVRGGQIRLVIVQRITTDSRKRGSETNGEVVPVRVLSQQMHG